MKNIILVIFALFASTLAGAAFALDQFSSEGDAQKRYRERCGCLA
jgi:hypothetical protein